MVILGYFLLTLACLGLLGLCVVLVIGGNTRQEIQMFGDRTEDIIELTEEIGYDDLEFPAAVTLEPIDLELGDHMTLQAFINNVTCSAIMDHDGFGRYATATHESSVSARPSEIGKGNIETDYTHVMWYNK